MSILPWDNLQTFVHDWMKGLQEIVDSIAPDPGADNSMLPLASLPYRFDTTVYSTQIVDNIIDGYGSSDKGYGYQPFVFAWRCTLYNNALHANNCYCIGKQEMRDPDRWPYLTAEDLATIEAARDALFTPDCLSVVNNYPTEQILIKYSHYGNVWFEPQFHSWSDIYITSPAKNSTTINSRDIGVQFNNMIIDTSGQYVTPYTGIMQFGQEDWGIPKTTKCIIVFDNDYDASHLVNDVLATGSAHNDVINYTKSGSEYKLYYGDTYLIYALNSSNIYNYQDLFTGTKQATDTINSWNPSAPPIETPTYDEVKHEDEPSELVSDNQEDGGNYNHAEFTKVYACTSAELENLYQWMGGGAAGSSGTSPVTVPDSFDPMNRIVGLIGYPMVIDAGVGDETTFTFRNAANQTINTGWSTYKYANFDRAFDFGTVDIPNWEELANKAPFLDYSATVEIYIPFCGIVGLDPQAVMGCTLSCKMWIDFLTGDCSAVVYTNYGGEDAQHPVAFVSGNCGSAEVVSANAFGAYQGAKAQASHKMSQAILGGFKDLATSVIGGATTGFTRGAANPSGTGGNAGMRAGAIGSVIGGAMNLGVNLTLQNLDNRYAVQVAKNALGTTISGSFGQQTSWYYMDKPYIKVTWPTPISKDVELYGKTFGVPVHRSGALNDFTGYTVCNNVDVSGITGATASELAIIKQFLETGVFIKEGGEE